MKQVKDHTAEQCVIGGSNGRSRKYLTALVLTLTIFAWCGTDTHAQCNPAPGTVITQKNWQQYKACFSAGEQYFWEGSGFWKMPDDVEIHVGAPHRWVLPQPYVEATEKYGAQTRLVRQADGRFLLQNYIAGTPFPDPQGPDKGTEIAADVTYRMQGYLTAVFAELGNPGAFYTKDHYGNWNLEVVDALYRQLAYNWKPGVPQTDPLANGGWYSEWLMVEQPEQSRYTAVLTIFYQDNLKDEDDYAFVPALRRSLRLSSAARCAPLLGSDLIKDDQRVGWNGGVGKFAGQFQREAPILTLWDVNAKVASQFPAEYDGLLGWPKPSWGNWEVRPADVIDVRRVPSLNPGYCYGSRIMYIDKQYYQTLAEDIYDSNQKLWKVMFEAGAQAPYASYGMQPNFGGIIENFFDVQNDHVSYVTTFNKGGIPILYDSQVPGQFNDVAKYSTPSGLQQLMR
jgi:hypothetical protein